MGEQRASRSAAPARLPVWRQPRTIATVLFVAITTLGYWRLDTAPSLVLAKILTPGFAGLMCIWFPNLLGRLPEHGGPARVTRETPAAVVYGVGWLLLLLPIPLILLQP